MIESIVKGAWLGFSIAAPVGPIGLLVLKESLTRGRWAGLACGLGAALADFVYGALAAAGIRFAAGYERPSAIIGGLFLLWLAWRSWRERPATSPAAEAADTRSLRLTGTTFLLTLSNPLTILMFAAMVASTGADAPGWFVCGVFLGSMLWWMILSTGASTLRRIIQVRATLLSRAAAVTLAAFGSWELVAKGLR